MSKEVSEERLKIKEIRKLKAEKKFYQIIKGSSLVLALLAFAGGTYAFVDALREKSVLSNSAILNSFIGLGAYLLSFISVVEAANISEDIKSVKEDIIELEEELDTDKVLKKTR